jgi:hypothetical protein
MRLNNMKLSSRQALLIAILSLILPVAWIEYRVLKFTHGVIAYPLDDTFIHMAISRNLAVSHFWGVSDHAFQSASSSPFYTILLAGLFLLFGIHTIIPLIVNVIAGIAVIVVAHRWLIAQGVAPFGQLMILLALNLLTPLPMLVIAGMEHTLQLLFTILFIYGFSDAMERKARAATGRLPWEIYLYGALMIATRYECLAVAGVACLLILRRYPLTAISLGTISILPILLFGVYALSKGGYLMPNSVIVKSAMPNSVHSFYHFLVHGLWTKLFFPLTTIDYNGLAGQRLLLILPLVYLLFLSRVRERISYRYPLIILGGATLFQVAFSTYLVYPRYEGFLIGCSVLVTGTLIAKYYREIPFPAIRGFGGWVAAALLVIVLMPILLRSTTTLKAGRRACINIYEQQYQMAQFVHRYYDSVPMAFNDIGAISFYSSGSKLDLVGLANLEVTKSRRLNYYTPDFLDSLSRRQKIRLAIVYDTWFSPDLLKRWGKVASWHMTNNFSAAEDSVSFFALDKSDTMSLRKNLEAFQPSLPSDVTVRYY